MVAPDIRALFSHGPNSGLPPVASSPPPWPEQSNRQLSLLPGSGSSTTAPATAASGPSFSLSQAPGMHQYNQSSSFNRLTSLPVDPWASPGKQNQQQQQHLPNTPGFPGAIGQFRTPPPGMNSVGNSGFYTPGGQGQQTQLFSPEGPYVGAMGYQTPGSVPSNHLYSNNSSPVQGASSDIANYSKSMGQQSPQQQHHPQQHHQPSPRRPMSGSFVSRDSMQFYEDKMVSMPSFGPGYGPALNSGNNRSHQQQMLYQQQQQQQPGQAYPPQSTFGQSIQYPQQRQRHSSHNSTASHHTMFLGPIGGGLGSAGGSVNSDDISTEDDSDEPFDDMRNRYRSYQFQHQGIQGGSGGLVPQTPPSSMLANRRGSVPSMGSTYSNQQLYDSTHAGVPLPNVVRLSNSSSDLYGRKSLVNSMNRLSLGQQPDNSFGSPRSLGGLGGSAGDGSPLNMANFSSGSTFSGSGERDLFSSGLGGIIGGATISHGGAYNTHTHIHTQSNNGSNQAGGNNGNVNEVQKEGRIGSTLSHSALPFLTNSQLDQSGHHSMVGGWDR
ncbi:hypothetical protein BC939DRAFT_276768 [Gamsiella multidivaricata]|uniref:uncharacterized protein n=1 Tax=Gamsiella multidivaricata TaxID=101098 RepID=UPI00221FD28C|nr:uncharacterized protein BC939DRAFT_276768 [Gamsiella multidivaricata]KAI7818871.1 hypothetical protein BC939DRAFT_276768 [Gamsiella multidivaricata]